MRGARAAVAGIGGTATWARRCASVEIEVKVRMDEGSGQLLMATFAYLLVLGGIIATVGLLAGA